jgi:hypothetical protein
VEIKGQYMKNLYISSLLLLSFFILGCSTSSNTATITYYTYTAELNSTLITNRESKIDVIAHYSNGDNKNVNELFIWSSSDENVATVTNGIIKTYNIEANVTIRFKSIATLANGDPVYSKNINYSVKNTALLKIAIDPTVITNFSQGLEKTLKATGYFDNNSTLDITADCNWTSSDENIVQIIDKGRIKAISEGTAQVKAIDKTGISQDINVTVTKSVFTKLDISTNKTYFNKDETIQLLAIGTNTNSEQIILTNDVNWSSSNTQIVTIDNKGMATALSIGDVNISASIGALSSNKVTLIVKKDKYLRLTNNDTNNSFEFPFASYSELAATNTTTTLAKFTLKAIGDNFTIYNLSVTDFYDNNLTTATFSSLKNGDIINKDENITFELQSDGSEQSLKYYFSIDKNNTLFFSSTYLRLK